MEYNRPSERLLARLTLAFVGAVLAALAPAPFPRRDDADLIKLQGEWVVAAELHNGKPFSRTHDDDHVMVIAGRRLTWFVQGEANDVSALRLKNAGRQRLFDTDRLPPGDRWNTRGIYRLCGGTLTVVFRSGKSEQDRPTEFDGEDDTYTLVFKRRKK